MNTLSPAATLHPVRVGSGTVVHAAIRTGRYQYKAVCGADVNRTGGVMRMTIPCADGTPFTCTKCLAKIGS